MYMLKGEKIPCIVTGKLSYFSKSLLEKKINKFGSVEEFKKYYVCPAARKLLRGGDSIDTVREKLAAPDNLPDVNTEVLYKLKILKINKRRGAKEAKEVIERQRYLNSREYRDKMLAIEERKRNMTFQEWVEENTGGPNRAWLNEGACTGTCIRPDIFLSHNNKACDGCPYYEYCLCRNRRLSHEKKRRR